MADLLSAITERFTPDVVSRVATQLGESDTAVARALPTATTAVLASRAAKASDSGVMRQIFDLVMNRDNDASTPNDVGATVARAMTAGSAATGLGATLLSAVLGGRANDVGAAIGRASGLTKPSSGASLLALAAPIVLGFLRNRVRQGDLGLSAFTRLLSTERESITAAVPPALRGFLDTGPTPAATARAAASPAFARPVVEEKSGNRWAWPVIGGLALAAILWALFGRGGPEPVTTALDSAAAATRTGVDSTLAAGQRAFDTAAGAVSGAVRDLGAMVKRVLPGGVTLDIPERGIESKLVAFIEDTSRPVNDTTWFEFDRLNFASGSATLLPESQEQLDNIAAVLKAYPTVNVKIGGYTDNTGDPTANQQLSQSRAESVMQALTTKGIAAKRLAAEGYGDKHPVADNATPEGRAKNRRIALRVTAK